MAQAAIKVGQAFIPIEVDFTGVNKKVAKSVARTMNYASKTATLPIRHTMFAGAAPAFTRALTRANFTADALFKGKFSNRLNKGLSQSLATAMSRTSVPVNANMFSGLAGAFQKGMKGGAVEPSSMFKGGLGGFSNFGRAAYSAFIAAFTVGSALTARTAIKSYGEFERAQLGLTSMLKSTEKANKLLEDIQDFAVVSPFNVQNLLDASKQLVAFRFNTEEIIPLMRDIGDAAAALGTGDEGIQRMIRAMGQIKVKGRVMAEELLQLNEIGVSGPHFLAEHLGITTDEALKRVNKGQVDAATGLEALRKGMQKYFGGSIKVQEGTLFGLWSNLKDQFEIAARMLFAPISDDAKGLLKGTIERLEKVRKWAETDWPAIVQKFRDDPKQAIRDMAKRMYDQFTQQDWSGAFTKIRAVFTAGFDLAKEVPWGDLWRDFRGKAWDAYLYVKHLDWPGIWAKTESAGASFAASLRSYDWEGLGATIKGEVLDAWETGKNIADYLKGKFEQVDWAGIGTNIADKLGAARQKIVDKIQEQIDGGLAKLAPKIDSTDFEAEGHKIGVAVGENIKSAIKWTVDTALDIGGWVKAKFDSVNWQEVWTDTSGFAQGLSGGLLKALFDVDNETLAAKVRDLFARIDALSKNGDLSTSVDIQLGAAKVTAETIETSEQAGETIGGKVKQGADIINRLLDPKEAALLGERVGNALNHAFAAAAASVGSIGDWLWGDDDQDQILFHVDSIWDRMKQSALAFFGGVVHQSFEGLTSFIGSLLYSLWGGVAKILRSMWNRFTQDWDKYVTVPLNSAIDAFNTISPVKIGKLTPVSDTYELSKKNHEEFNKPYWEEIKRLLTPPTVEEHRQRYAEQHGYNRWENVPKEQVKRPSSWHGWGTETVERPVGKSARVEVHQHFEGRYIEPEQAKRASKLGIRAGV